MPDEPNNGEKNTHLHHPDRSRTFAMSLGFTASGRADPTWTPITDFMRKDESGKLVFGAELIKQAISA